jgi:S-formylglutathione hydrolase FrmB
LGLGLVGGAVVVGAGIGLFELVDHTVLPGHQELIKLLGDCDVSVPPATFSPLGPTESGAFYSKTRNQTVGYTIAYPPDHGPGDRLPLIVVLHAFGANHTNALAGMSLPQALALHVNGQPLPPMAMVAADGGNGSWHAHPGDNPLGMVVSELLPMCWSKDLGVGPQRGGAMGLSMGGYGVLNLATHEPTLVSAVAAISPGAWMTYPEAHNANPEAFGSEAEFAANDIFTHAELLTGIPVHIESGTDDPFRPDVQALARVLPQGTVVVIRKGCHDGNFMRSAEPTALAFLGTHLTT